MKCSLIEQSCLIYIGCVLDLPHYACYSVVWPNIIFIAQNIKHPLPGQVSQQAPYCTLTRILIKSNIRTVSWYTDYSLVNATLMFHPGEKKVYIIRETLITMNNLSRIWFINTVYCITMPFFNKMVCTSWILLVKKLHKTSWKC